MTLIQLLRIIKYRRLLILILTIIIASTIFSTVFFVIPTSYEAKTQLLLTENTSTALPYSQSQQMAANIQLLQTYNDLIKSNAILTNVIETLQLNQTLEALAKNVHIENERNSFVVTLYVKAQKKDDAINIANAIAQVVKQQLPKIIQNNEVKILSPAVLVSNEAPIWKQPPTLALLSITLALATATTLTIAKEGRATTIFHEDQLLNLTPNVLGTLSKK